MSSPSHSNHSPNLSEQLSIVEQLRSNPYHRAELAAAETVENVLALFDETIDDSKAQLIADTYNIPLEKVNTVVCSR